MSRVVDKGNGKYQLVVDLGYLPSGKRDRRVKTIEAKNNRMAEKMLVKLEAEYFEDSEKIDTAIKFPIFIERWKKEFGSLDLEPSTYEIYCYELDASIIPHFKAARIANITTYDLVRYMNIEKRNGIGQYALEIRHRVLRSVFGKAKEWNVIKKDPSRDLKKPKIKRREKEVYNEKEINQVLDCMEKETEEHQLMILCALTAGLRRGEVLGIDLDQDINYENRQVHICHSLQSTKTQGRILKDCKSDSERIVIFAQFLINRIEAYRKERWKERDALGDTWKGFKDKDGNDHFLLFSHPDGTPYDPHSLTQIWGRFVKRHNLKEISYHDLRHSAVTFWLSQDVPMNTVRKILGHHDISTTMNIYAHVYDEDLLKAANMFDELEKRREKRKNKILGNDLGNETEKSTKN